MACTFDKPQISVLHDYSRKGAHSPKIIETSCLGDVQKEVVNPAPTKRFRDLGLMVIWLCIGGGVGGCVKTVIPIGVTYILISCDESLNPKSTRF